MLKRGDRGLEMLGTGIRDTWVRSRQLCSLEIATYDAGEVNTPEVVEIAELHERDTQDLRDDLLMGDRMISQRQYGWWRRRLCSREAGLVRYDLSQATHQSLDHQDTAPVMSDMQTELWHFESRPEGELDSQDLRLGFQTTRRLPGDAVSRI
ncbi:hypothetical protein Tco_1154877 [Tanacetum coccineum]